MHDWLFFPDHEYRFVRGKTKNRLFGAKRLSFKVAARRMNFNIIERQCLSGFVLKMMDGAISGVKSNGAILFSILKLSIRQF